MGKSFLQALLLFLFLIVAWVAFILHLRSNTDDPGPEPTTEDVVSSPSEEIKSEPAAELTENTAVDVAELGRDWKPEVPLDPELAAWIEFFDQNPDLNLVRRSLADFKRWAFSIPPEEASRRLRAWLEQSPERSTTLNFVVGPDGLLREASTWRAFLLDLLGQVDPEGAFSLAEEAFAQPLPESAAEFSLHLRNFGQWASSVQDNRRDTLIRQWNRLAANESWVNEASLGFLESFDVLVETHAVAELPLLFGWLEVQSGERVKKAAKVTLDRLAVETGETVFASIVENDAIAKLDPTLRPAILARADPGDPVEVAALEVYLLDTPLSPEERKAFYGRFPNLQIVLVHGLLSEPVEWTHEEVTGRLETARTLYQRWLRDPRFSSQSAEIQAGLDAVEQRLGLN